MCTITSPQRIDFLKYVGQIKDQTNNCKRSRKPFNTGDVTRTHACSCKRNIIHSTKVYYLTGRIWRASCKNFNLENQAPFKSHLSRSSIAGQSPLVVISSYLTLSVSRYRLGSQQLSQRDIAHLTVHLDNPEPT